jgi:hypothetical protein
MRPKNIYDWFAKRQAPCLVTNQGAKQVSRSEHGSNRGTNGFLPFSQVDTPGDFSCAPQAPQFFLDRPREQHPFKRPYVKIWKWRWSNIPSMLLEGV